MYISAAGAQAQSKRIEVISNNLANVDTPGFKRSLAILQARSSEAIEQGLDVEGSRSINDIGGGVNMTETATDFGPGTLKPTGVITDMAINDDGRGFFVIEKEGQQLLTRAGNFHFAANGELQNPAGYRVLNANDSPIAIVPGGPEPKLLPNGIIQQGETAFQLKLVRANSLGDLARAGENAFTPLAETVPLPSGERNVVSGHLEISSVKPATEMMHLIEASRAYEANVKLIQNQDQMLGTLINRVLRQS